MGWLDNFTNTVSQAFADFRKDVEGVVGELGVSTTQDVSIDTATAFAQVDLFFLGQTCTTSDDGDIPQQVQQQAIDGLKALKVGLDAGVQIRVASVGVEKLAEKLAEQLERSDHDPMPITDVDFSDSQLDAQKVLDKRTRDCLQILFKALVKQLLCCDTNHFGRIKLTGFTEQFDDKSRVFFDIFLSSRYDWEPCRWLKSRCTIEKAISEKEEPGCHIIRNSEALNEILNLHLEESEAGTVQRGKCCRVSSMATPTVALGELLDRGCFRSIFNTDDNNYFLPFDKAVLCFNLSLSLLHLSHNEWRRVRWSAESIFFLKDPGSQMLLEKTQPYLSWRLQQHSAMVSHNEDQLLCDSHLLDFARLLMEIHGGERIKMPGPMSSSRLRSRVSQLIKNRRSFLCYQEKFKIAIEACIGAAGKEAAQDLSAPERIQIFIFQNIVLNLEAYLRECTEPLEHTPVSTTRQAHGTVDVADGTKKSLYDASRYQTPEDLSAAHGAYRFLSLMEDFNEKHIKPLKLLNFETLPDHRSRKIKIAVIDSGVKKNDPRIRGARKAHLGKIRDCRNFVTSDPEDWDDDFGHGTLVSLLLMQVAPEVEIFVAKVSNGQYIEKDKLHCIARAINWAVQVWQVDIITMSLILPEADTGIEKELKQALDPSYEGAARKIVFAAAGNSGGNAPRGWPACRKGVIAVHATDGLGFAANINPNIDEDDENFATLGRDIKLCHNPSGKTEQDKNVYISGTSFATPIAAGIAANVLEFARHRLNLTVNQRKLLCSGGCMKKVFREMMGKRGGYGYIQPWTLWAHGNRKHKDICDVLKAIIEEY